MILNRFRKTTVVSRWEASAGAHQQRLQIFLLAALVAGAFGVNTGARTFGINLDVSVVVGSAVPEIFGSKNVEAIFGTNDVEGVYVGNDVEGVYVGNDVEGVYVGDGLEIFEADGTDITS